MAKAKNKCPNQIKIGPIPYQVVFKDTLEQDENALGNIDDVEGTISLQSDMCEHITAVILVHEIIHGIFNAIGEPDLNDEEHEPFIERTATLLTDTLINSPDLLDYLKQLR